VEVLVMIVLFAPLVMFFVGTPALLVGLRNR
jgi:hypothetical protein